MLLKRLSLTQFRIFDRLDAEFTTGTTILVGSNAQGKTSILEAIYYLTSANGVQATHDRELISFGALQEATPYARIVAQIESHSRDQTIEIRLSLRTAGDQPRPRLMKEILINGVKRRVSDLAGVFNAVLFLPRDIDVVEGSPGNRRDFLDASLAQADPAYAAALTEYRKVISQRNALLKQLRERRGKFQQLDFWDQRLSEHGSLLMEQRARALSELNSLAARVHQELSRGKEQLELLYLPKFDPTRRSDGQMHPRPDRNDAIAALSRARLSSALTERLNRIRKHEIQRGVSTLGPHRDDFQFCINGVDLGRFGSRGQNRTALLALKLAEIQWLKHRTGEWPVLLLDEVLAELDVERRSDLLERLKAAPQSLLTAADPDMFLQRFLRSATIWKVSAEGLTPYSNRISSG
ncbi:MAG: DNA replication/repair protein RecF [Anaerolineales bacterium]|nr:DNA replication/repair protein RecF [Anaerolineales bacterium]